MKIGRLITVDGIELNLDGSQLRELTEYLRRQEVIEAIASETADGAGFVDPEDYERAAQAAWFATRVKALPIAA